MPSRPSGVAGPPGCSLRPSVLIVAAAQLAAPESAIADAPSMALAPGAAASIAPAPAAGPAAVTVAGSLQSELGCPGDWDPTCAATDLPSTAGGRHQADFALPAGSYEFKVAIEHSWDENCGAGGVPNGANIPLVLLAAATVTVGYGDASHLVTLSSANTPSTTAPLRTGSWRVAVCGRT